MKDKCLYCNIRHRVYKDSCFKRIANLSGYDALAGLKNTVNQKNFKKYLKYIEKNFGKELAKNLMRL